MSEYVTLVFRRPISDEVRAMVERAEWIAATHSNPLHERDALRAEIEAMEKQEPVAWIVRGGYPVPLDKLEWQLWYGSEKPTLSWVNQETRPLYALPGAQAQPAPSLPEGWKLVPIEPTEKMINEGTCASTLPGPRYIDSACAKQCWTNMLAATPEAKP